MRVAKAGIVCVEKSRKCFLGYIYIAGRFQGDGPERSVIFLLCEAGGEFDFFQEGLMCRAKWVVVLAPPQLRFSERVDRPPYVHAYVFGCVTPLACFFEVLHAFAVGSGECM